MLDLDQLADLDQLVDPIPDVLLRVRELHRVHVAGSVLEDEQKVQGHRGHPDPPEDGEEEPPHPGQQRGDEGRDGDLQDQELRPVVFCFRFVEPIRLPHVLQLVDRKGQKVSRRFVETGAGLVDQPARVPEDRQEGRTFVLLDGDARLAHRDVGRAQHDRDEDDDPRGPPERLQDPGLLHALGVEPGSGHDHPVVGLVVEAREGDHQEDPDGDQPEEDRPEEIHVQPAAQHRVLRESVASGKSLVVGDVEGEQEAGRTRQHDPDDDDEFRKVGVVLVVGMLVVHQQVHGDHQQQDEGHRHDADQEDLLQVHLGGSGCGISRGRRWRGSKVGIKSAGFRAERGPVSVCLSLCVSRC
mmetsp:Transcript_15157/g.35126  ORF Transcript_15157/g.35126 Transcript_15157/m.35126 type:complete len:355 (+) Transcript_15157:1126-2190(+)